MELVQDGDMVTGTYTCDEGRIEGMASDGRLTGTWSEEPSYQPSDDTGDFVFTLSEDGASFTGQWRYGKEGEWEGSWNGHKVSRVLIGK